MHTQTCVCVYFYINIYNYSLVKYQDFLNIYFILFYFLERGREGGKHHCVAASHTPPTGDLANLGICPTFGIEAVTLWLEGRPSIRSATSTRAKYNDF